MGGEITEPLHESRLVRLFDRLTSMSRPCRDVYMERRRTSEDISSPRMLHQVLNGQVVFPALQLAQLLSMKMTRVSSGLLVLSGSS